MKYKINKNKLFLAFSFVICLTVLIGCVFLSGQDSIKSIKIVVNADNNFTSSISLYYCDDKYYAFLPSYTKLDKTTIKSDSGYRISINNKNYNQNVYCSDLSFDVEYKIKLINIFGIAVSEENLILMRSANIPTISISLADGRLTDIDNDKTVNKTGSITTITEEGCVDFLGSFKDMHSRGNASWLSSKKPYTIEFSENVNLLELGACSKWVLLANSYDPSNLKNKIVYEASNELGMRYFCNSEYVDLYVDGEYRGLYLLVEKIDVGLNQIKINNLEAATQNINFKKLSAYDLMELTNAKNGCQFLRAYDIPNNPDDITGGYIIKSESAERIVDDSYFITEDNRCYDCKSPQYASTEQIEYISSLFKSIEDSLDDYEKVSELIDIDSFIKRYLMQECFANCEGSSFYFIKDSDNVDSKVYAEPVWDFDNSLGTGDTEFSTGLYCNTYIFNKLMTNESFKQKVISMYSELFSSIWEGCKSKIINYSDRIRNSDRMNKIRWKSMYGENSPLDESTKKLIDYINEREVFLNNTWLNNEKYVNIIFDDPENIIDYYKSKSIKKGDVIGDVEQLERKGYKFSGWYDSATGNKINTDEPVYENCLFVAKWEIVENENKTAFWSGDIIESLYLIKKQIMRDLDFYLSLLLFSVFMITLLTLLALNRPPKRK